LFPNDRQTRWLALVIEGKGDLSRIDFPNLCAFMPQRQIEQMGIAAAERLINSFLWARCAI
jgi:hypothetical protein